MHRLTSKLFLVMAALVFISGCATFKEPAFHNKVTVIDTSKESVGFFTVKVGNNVNRSYQPNVKYAFVWEDKADPGKFSINVLPPYNAEKGEYNEYLISFQLAPGKYVLRELFAQSGIFPVIGTFGVPLYKKLDIPANKVIYLGHIDAVIEERTEKDQLRAGPVIPLIDQAVVGASKGTFVVNIEDRFAADVALLKQQFAALADLQVENMTLSPWQQPTREQMQVQ